MKKDLHKLICECSRNKNKHDQGKRGRRYGSRNQEELPTKESMRYGRYFGFGENLSPLLRAMKKMAREGASADEIISAVKAVVPKSTLGDHVLLHANEYISKYSEARRYRWTPIQEQKDGSLKVVEGSGRSKWIPTSRSEPWYKVGDLDGEEVVYKVDGVHVWKLSQAFRIRHGTLYHCVQWGDSYYFPIFEEKDAKWTALTKKEKKRLQTK